MATFEIQAPDGQKYRVEGADQAGALAALQKMLGAQTQKPRGVMETVNNTINQLGTGAYRGITGLIGLPGTMAELGASLPVERDYLKQFMPQNPDPRLAGAGEQLARARQAVADTLPSGAGILGAAEKYLPGFKTAEPKTRMDRFLQTTGEFAAPGGTFGRAGVVGGAISGAATQTARELDAPKWVEFAAGIGAPLLAAGVTSAIRSIAPSAERQLTQALRTVTEQEIRGAEQLMRQAQQAGNPVTWSEALNQVSNGRFGQLAQLQRVVEQSPGGAGPMSQIMSQRLEQSRGLAQQNLNRVGPQPQGQALEAVPYRVQGAAENVIQGERDITNALSRPAYEATTGTPAVRLPAQNYQRLTRDYPNLPDAVQAVRADPIRYGNLDGLADDSYAVLDQVKKYLDDTAVVSGRAGQNYGASNAQGLSNAIRDTLAQANPRYGSALNIQSIRQRHAEEPLRRGQVGQLSEAQPTIPAQRGKLLPIGKQETIDPQTITATVQRLEQEAPGSARDWLRTNLQSEWDEVLKAFKTAGADESRGASLWANLAGNEGRRANLQAYVDALDPSGNTWRGFENMLQIMGAQRYRLPANSATAFNQETIAALKGKGIPVSLEDINPVSLFQGEVKQAGQIARYRINSQRLADLLLDPNAATRLRALAGMRPNTSNARMLAGSILTTFMPDSARRDE